MRILFLSQRVPYPPNRGDKITTWRLIDRMRREHQVHVVCFEHDADDRAAAGELRGMGLDVHTFPYRHKKQLARALPLLLSGRALTLGVYGSGALQACVDQLAPQCDVAYAYSSSMGAFLLPHPGLPKVMHFAELDSDKWAQYAQKTRFPWSWVYGREARTLLSFEREVAAASAQNVFCTPLEQRIFQERIPGPDSAVLRNGVDLEFYHPRENAPEPAHLAFTGVMDYYPNVDACQFFVSEVLPLVRKRFPETRFTIIGSRPTKEIEALGELEGVTVTGFVDDTRDWLRRAAISVAPLRIARGIQNKVLEAMAMGLPVVGSTSATQGVEGQAGEHFLLADSAEDTAEAVCALLADPELAARTAASGRAFVEQNYDWEVLLDQLNEILAQVSGRAPVHGTSENEA